MSYFNSGVNHDGSDALANAGYALEFYHVDSEAVTKFKAFITSLSEQYQSNWDKEEIYGRMDPIQTFKSTQRTISVSWDIVGGSSTEAQQNLSDLQTLFNMLYPTYQGRSSGTTGMIAAPLLRMKYRNLIAREGASDGDVSDSGLLGTVDGFTFEPQMDDAMYSDAKGNLFPKVIKLSCNFSVIHEHPLGWTSDGDSRNDGFPWNAWHDGTIAAEDTFSSDGPSEDGPGSTSEPSDNNVNNETVPKENSKKELTSTAKNEKITSTTTGSGSITKDNNFAKRVGQKTANADREKQRARDKLAERRKRLEQRANEPKSLTERSNSLVDGILNNSRSKG